MLICRQQLRRKNVLSQVGKETLQLAGEDYIEVNFLNTHCVYLLDLVAASVVAIGGNRRDCCGRRYAY